MNTYLTQAQFDQEMQQLFQPPTDNPPPPPPTNTNTSMELLAGMSIGATGRKFHLIKKIGEGGMGQVWQARDLAEEVAETDEGKTAKPIYKALKVVNSTMMYSPAAIKKLQREAIRSARLSHPNIINVNNWHQGTEGWLFVEMEYLQGQDLETYLIDYETGISWQDSQPMIEAVVQGLHYAHHEHEHVIIHRDLKPGNIYLTQQGRIKILDFGLAYQMRNSSNSAASITPSTAQYMPPEAFYANNPDPRQDVYALACIIYEMLTGAPPYSKEKAEKRDKNEWPPKPENLKEQAWQALQGGMAYDKEQRTATVKLLWEEIQLGQVENGGGRDEKNIQEAGYYWTMIVFLLLSTGVGAFLWVNHSMESKQIDEETVTKNLICATGNGSILRQQNCVGSEMQKPGN